MSNLTVADVRAACAALITAGGDILAYTNQVTERLTKAGLYNGLFAFVDFDAATGYLTLPSPYESLLGCCVRCVPVPVYGGFHEFTESGPGFDENLTFDRALLIDDGQFPTYLKQDGEYLIRLTISNPADAGKKVTLFGYNTNAGQQPPRQPIYSATGSQGIELTLVYPSVTTSVPMMVTSVRKADTLAPLTLSTVNGATITPLSTYAPREPNPMYRRYKIGTIQPTANGYPAIHTKCKRRWMSVYNDADPVYPPNLGAIKMGIMAMNYEESGAADQVADAEKFWNKADELLQQELRHIRGAARFDMNLSQGDGVGAFNSW